MLRSIQLGKSESPGSYLEKNQKKKIPLPSWKLLRENFWIIVAEYFAQGRKVNMVLLVILICWSQSIFWHTVAPRHKASVIDR